MPRGPASLGHTAIPVLVSPVAHHWCMDTATDQSPGTTEISLAEAFAAACMIIGEEAVMARVREERAAQVRAAVESGAATFPPQESAAAAE